MESIYRSKADSQIANLTLTARAFEKVYLSRSLPINCDNESVFKERIGS